MKETTQQKAKIGVVCLALLALAAMPLASAEPGIGTNGQTHVFVDKNGDGDCSDPGEHSVVPTPNSQGYVWIGCSPY